MQRAPITEPEVAETYRLRARRPPSLRWAKAELLLGLGAVAAGCWLEAAGHHERLALG